MKFSLRIDMGNAAFEDDPGELSRILERLARELREERHRPGDRYRLADINGNTVGEAKVTR
jgi:hypothetical protein